MSRHETKDVGNIERAMLAGLSRRGFLGASGAAVLAALAGSEPRLLASPTKIAPRADSLILLWMAGGMAQTETFDPKRYTAFEPGLESKRVLSTFPAIDLSLIHISRRRRWPTPMRPAADFICNFSPANRTCRSRAS